jgi:hypothetical protein
LSEPGAVAASIRAAADAGQSSHRAREASGRHFADRIILRIGHIDISRGVSRHAAKIVETSAAAETVGPASPGVACGGAEGQRLAKSQAPSSKNHPAKRDNNQAPKPNPALVDVWNLMFLWSLELGAWSFPDIHLNSNW